MLNPDHLAQLDQLFADLPPISRLYDARQGLEEQNALVQTWMGLPDGASVQIDLLRLDSVHSFISGNKWYKLKQHLFAACSAGKSQLLSFGGAHSNHLHALAYAGKELGIESIGVVRGEPHEALTPTLQDCQNWGMQLQWLSRRDYRTLAPIADNDHSFAERYPNAWVIPEGGSGQYGIEGIRELMLDLYHQQGLDHQYIVCPVGTGTTLAGISAAGLPGVKCIGFSALKGALDLEHQIELELGLRERVSHWEVNHDYHFGGFAKLHDRLKTFISNFHQVTDIVLDPIYTGKMLFGITEWIRQGRLPENAKILLVHTGGLQGWRGFGDMRPLIGDDE